MLAVKQVTRSIVSHCRFNRRWRGSHSRSCELLTHVANSAAELRSLLRELFIFSKEMSVRRKHGPAAAGVRNDWTVGVESRDIFPRQFACAVEISRMRM